MTVLLEPTLYACKEFSSAIEKATTTLADNFGLNSFYYYKIMASGHFALFENSIDVTQIFESGRFIFLSPACCHPKFHRSRTTIYDISNDPIFNTSEMIRKSLLDINLGLRIHFTQKTDQAVEEFGFNSMEKAKLLPVNFLNELRLFMRWFIENNKQLFGFLNESGLNLRTIIGDDFDRDKIGNLPDLDQIKLKFLRDLGLQTDWFLSEEELKTVSLIVEGYTADQIAKKLYRSRRTIENRTGNIKAKWNCSSRAELFEKARELQSSGLLVLPDQLG